MNECAGIDSKLMGHEWCGLGLFFGARDRQPQVVVGEIKLATCLERPMIGSDGWLTLDIYLCIYIRIHIYMYACVYVLCV